MQATKTIVSPAKLQDGSWGVTTTDILSAGDVVTVKTRSGKEWDTKIVADCGTSRYGVLYSTKKYTSSARSISITLRGGDRSPSRSRSTWSGCACGSVEEYTKNSDCWTCKHDAE